MTTVKPFGSFFRATGTFQLAGWAAASIRVNDPSTARVVQTQLKGILFRGSTFAPEGIKKYSSIRPPETFLRHVQRVGPMD
jgi:hypothetical protein